MKWEKVICRQTPKPTNPQIQSKRLTLKLAWNTFQQKSSLNSVNNQIFWWTLCFRRTSMEIMDLSDGKSIRWLALFPEKKKGVRGSPPFFWEEIWVKYNFIQIDMGRLGDDCFLFGFLSNAFRKNLGWKIFNLSFPVRQLWLNKSQYGWPDLHRWHIRAYMIKFGKVSRNTGMLMKLQWVGASGVFNPEKKKNVQKTRPASVMTSAWGIDL